MYDFVDVIKNDFAISLINCCDLNETIDIREDFDLKLNAKHDVVNFGEVTKKVVKIEVDAKIIDDVTIINDVSIINDVTITDDVMIIDDVTIINDVTIIDVTIINDVTTKNDVTIIITYLNEKL